MLTTEQQRQLENLLQHTFQLGVEAQAVNPDGHPVYAAFKESVEDQLLKILYPRGF